MNMFNAQKVAVILFALIASLWSSKSLSQSMPEFSSQKAEPEVYIWGARNSTDAQMGIMARMPEPWKTYWRTPGEGGELPRIEWSSKSNIESWEWHWPTPQRLDSGGISILGYQREVFFPLTFKVSDPTKPINLKGTLNFPMCTTICTFHRFEFDLTLESGDKMSQMEREAWAGHWGKAPDAQTDTLTYNWEASDKEGTLTVYYSGTGLQDAFIFKSPQGVLPLRFEKPTQGDEALTIPVSSWSKLPDVLPGNLFIHLKTESGEVTYPLQDISKNEGAAPDELPWWSWLFALGGGFILNFMPCVLPVLGMKLNSLLVSDNPTLVRKQLMYSGTGVVGTFVVIGATLSLLQLSGHQIGWGIQFQSPWFLGALVLLVSGFAVSLLFGMNWLLPRSWMDKLSTAGSEKPFGHVIQGVTATLLATPCTAPMLGTAVGLALATSPLISIALFAVIGIGMASPWLLVALYPPAQKVLPKPGPWLAWVKPVFGVAMLGTAIWLGSIWWLYHGDDSEIKLDAQWGQFSQEILDQHVADGDTVLVDVTAAWCMTCKSNKALVLDTDGIRKHLAEQGVIQLQGDWTRQDNTITTYIQSHKRYGIPLNVVYGPYARDGIVLPEILTSSSLKKAIRQASGN
jgi:suppressor for copper-sensitivity B